MKTLALYELSHDYLSALEALTDPEADLPLQAVTDTLEGLQYPFAEKAANVAKFMRNLEATTKAIKDAENQMAARRKALENRASWIKDYLKHNMEATGITTIESPWFRLSVQNNPPAVEITDEGQIPEDFREVVESIKIDKAAIKTAIQNGTEVPGARLVRGTRLNVR